MDGALFTLVNSENHDQVFAWGMEIWYEYEGSETEKRVAVIYRHESGDQQDMHGLHESAESARDFHSRMIPIDLDVMWQDPVLADLLSRDGVE